MKYVFQPPSNQGRYQDEKWLRKKYKDKALSDGIMGLWQFLDNAENAYDIMAMAFYRFHELKGDRNGTYSISPIGRHSPFRLIVVCLDADGKECAPSGDERTFLLGITKLEIKEITNHYD